MEIFLYLNATYPTIYEYIPNIVHKYRVTNIFPHPPTFQSIPVVKDALEM